MDKKQDTMQYLCKRCGYTTERKGDFKKHLQKKHPCPVVHEDVSADVMLQELEVDTDRSYECEHCSKRFSTASSKSVHKKTCAKRPMVEHEKIEYLEKQIEALKNQVQEARVGQVNNNNHCVNGNVTVNNNIQINSFGKEDITYLTTHPRFNDFMVKCIRGKVEGICEFLVKKHFHPEHPENHNIKKLNKKDEFIECYDGSKWKLRFCEDALDDIFMEMQRDFANFVEAEEGMLKKVWLDTFMDQVGGPLNWDLSTQDYDGYRQLSDEKRAEFRAKIYKLAVEHIYRHSKACNDLLQ